MAVQELVTLLPRLEKFDLDFELKTSNLIEIKQVFFSKIIRALDELTDCPKTAELRQHIFRFNTIDQVLTESITSDDLFNLEAFISLVKELVTPKTV